MVKNCKWRCLLIGWCDQRLTYEHSWQDLAEAKMRFEATAATSNDTAAALESQRNETAASLAAERERSGHLASQRDALQHELNMLQTRVGIA
jgi:hypothetical protein